jgi:hypothetical protein
MPRMNSRKRESALYELPLNLLYLILGDFVDVNGLVRLDSATCNQKYRELFLDTVRQIRHGKTFTELFDLGSLKWIYMRKIPYAHIKNFKLWIPGQEKHPQPWYKQSVCRYMNINPNPLCWCAQNDSIEAIQLLLDCPSDVMRVNIEDRDGLGFTALLVAVHYGNLATIRILIEKYHCNVNVQDFIMDNHSLHLIPNSDTGYRMAQLLIDSNADVNLANRQGFTPLHNAVSTRNEALVKLLLSQRNIDANKRTYMDGDSPLHIACKAGYLSMASVLLRDEEVDSGAINNANKTPLQEAERNKHMNIVSFLREKLQIVAEPEYEQQ